MDIVFVAANSSDGGTSIVQLVARAPLGAFSPDVAEANGYVLEADRWVHSWTDEQIATHLKDMPQGFTDWKLLDGDPRPPYGQYHRALKLRDGALTFDLVLAREILRSQLRKLRAPLLAALDIEFMRADETGDVAAKARIAARKATLRDVTNHPTIEMADTEEKLSAVVGLLFN